MSNLELLDRAAGQTMCDILRAAGPALVHTSVIPLWAPKLRAVSFGAGALSLLASNYLCSEMPMGDTTPGGVNGCGQMAPGGYGESQRSMDGGKTWGAFGEDIWDHREVTAISKGEVTQGNFGTWRASISITYRDGSLKYSDSFNKKEWADAAQYRIEPIYGECARPETPPPAPTPDAAKETYTYTDNSTNCTYNVTLQGFAQESEGGIVQPVFRIESASSSFADGGVMGGCNFAPTIYMPTSGGGGGGGGVYVPYPDNDPGDDDGVPWWVPALAGALGGAAANQLADLINDLTAPKYEAADFTLTAPCDFTEEGDNKSYFFPFPKGSFEQRVIDHQEAILQVLQYHLNSKTPICQPEATPLEGEWITTRWQSDEVMVHSGRRLRKLFRYRSKSSRELQQLSSYWESFVWRSGPVCVKHKGAWWGYPQVWAESIEEGKRVIRFAGAEAGIDPDQTGRWEISGSRAPRYGMPGTMRILQHKGFPWVASRDGADWPNILAREV